LSQFGVLKISGEDAQTFLQNMLSSDVREVGESRAQLGSFNTAKGRMLATMLVWKNGADYFLHLPRGLTAAIQKKFSLYVLRSKVKISDASDEIICLGLAGREAEKLLGACFPTVPQTIMSATQHEGDSLIRLGAERFQIATTPQHAPSLWQRLTATGAHAAGSACWDWLTLRAGIPVVLPATQEAFVPQMANLELIGGVNFKKGCYPGQEIVARVQYLGKSKRRMYLAHVAANAQAGEDLFSADNTEQSCGTVVNAAPAPDGGVDLLAVVQTGSLAGAVHLGSPQGEVLQFLTLPYLIPD
jgi:folate-binding protein YgfZ